MLRLIIAAAFVFAPFIAFAHSWYDSLCCNTRDCAPVAPGVITATSEGWLVIVGVGDHPLATEFQIVVVPYGDDRIRMSQDDEKHLCMTSVQKILCVYVPFEGA